MQSKRYAAGGLEPFTGVDAETPGDILQRMDNYDSLMGHKAKAGSPNWVTFGWSARIRRQTNMRQLP